MDYKKITNAPELCRIGNDKRAGAIPVFFEMIGAVAWLWSQNLWIGGFQGHLTELADIDSIEFALVHIFIVHFLLLQEFTFQQA